MTPEALLALTARSTAPDWAPYEQQLSDVAFREALYRLLQRGLTRDDRSQELLDPRHASLLRALFARELAFRDDLWHGRGEDPDDDYENIYCCALLLYFLRDPRHVDLLWRAKRLNMDVGSGLDGQCFVGAGPARTLQHLSSLDEPWARDAHQYLVSCNDGGDFDDLPAWEQARKAYFADDA